MSTTVENSKPITKEDLKKMAKALDSYKPTQFTPIYPQTNMAWSPFITALSMYEKALSNIGVCS